jgi:hypothetical protein
MIQRTVSIGFMREDGDFAILATLNNEDNHLSHEDFNELVAHVASTLCRKLVLQIEVIEREDTPSYVNLDESYW